MTLEELYQNINGDYDKAIRVMCLEKLVDKHIRKFPGNGVAERLFTAAEKADATELFEAAHAMKGICANLGLLGAWALAFGCSVGWGSFVMPGTTFLPVAGPVGTAIGLSLGGLVMLLLAVNYHYLMNRYPDGGGTYTYTKKTFGYDHGFLGAWFLILTYIAVIWANATALPLIARTLLGDTFRFGYLYEIAGYQIYLGELLLALSALVIAAVLCMFRKPASCTQVVMAVILFLGVVICFIAASGWSEAKELTPVYAPDRTAANGIFTIFALAPWAYVGFESISHSAAEAKFSLKKTFRVMLISLISAAVCYVLLSLLAVKALPEGCDSWTDYIHFKHLDAPDDRQGSG